jgi:hypothetical protein
MVTITSIQSGDWSSASTWDNGVPANGDAVIIASGHTVVFDVNQSGFANGLLSMAINGTLRFKVDSITALKMNGNITGAGSLYVGNSEQDPIQRPPSGTESRCQIIFNSSGTINVPIIRMYGWYPSREYTQLDADAALNATTIVLKEDLGLQAGDKIAIGIGSINDKIDLSETAKGVYTVSAYDSATKTVTLSSGLQTARLNNDYTCTASRPIKITRTSGTNPFITTKIDNMLLIGTYFGTYWFLKDGPENLTCNFATFKHCTSGDKVLVAYGKGHLIEFCTRVGGGSSQFIQAYSSEVKDSICISGSYVAYNNNLKVTRCIQQNTQTITLGNPVTDCVFNNFAYINPGGNCTYINCVFKGNDTDEIGASTAANTFFNQLHAQEFHDCIFKDNGIGYLKAIEAKLYNCLFEGTNEINNNTRDIRPVNSIIESFNHNQTPGNYKAWMRGGRIETENNKLKFICESNDYPVFRDYPILAPANRTIKQLIALTKDTPGIVTNLQIIDPANDPLIDPTASPLAESIATNTTDNQQIGVAYKSTTPRQLILRILCQNSTGTVLVDTTRIDQSLAKRIK